MRSIDNRDAVPSSAGSIDRQFSLSDRIFLVLKKPQDLEGSSVVEKNVSNGSIRVLRMNSDDVHTSSRVVVEVATDLEGSDVAQILRDSPSVTEVFPVLQTESGSIHPARLNTIVIALKSKSAIERAKFSKDYGLALESFDYEGNVGVYRILDSGKNVDDLWESLSKDQRIKYAEPNFVVDEDDFQKQGEPTVETPANDPKAASNYRWNHRLIGLDKISNEFNGSGVTVAVVDARANVTHESLVGRVVASSEEFEFAAGHAPFFADHGNQVAGIIGGQPRPSDGQAIGIAAGCAILPVSIVTTSEGEYTSRAKALNQLASIRKAGGFRNKAGKRIDVVRLICNCSWNLPNPPPINMEEAILNLSNSGALIVCSAGNSGKEKPHYPSDYDFCVSVSAVGPLKTLGTSKGSIYSNFGTNVDLCAPGGDDDSDDKVPEKDSAEIVSCGLKGYVRDTGTSFAAPHVSGALALVWSAMPEATGVQVVKLVLDMGTTDITLENPAYEGKIGRGLIDLERCIQAALAWKPE